MSEDPKLFDAGDYNLFRYCHNDPVDLTDPMGLDPSTGAGQMEDRRSKDHQSYDLEQREKFVKAVNQFIRNYRPDASGIDARDVGKAAVEDARAAAQEQAKDVRPGQYGRRRGTSEERAYAEYAEGKKLHREGPATGSRDAQGQPQSPLPGSSRNHVPLIGSHSHGPESINGFDRHDIPSANGANPTGKRYVSSVGWTGDRGRVIHVYVPGGAGSFFHSSDGVNFYSGQ